MRGRYGRSWRSSTVRNTVRRADPELYAIWSTWCADRIVRRDLRADRERARNNLERLRRHAAAYRQEIVRIVEPLVVAGYDSTPKLAAELARLGVPTARGGRWDGGTVRKMLRRERPRLHRTIRPRSPRERSEAFAAQLRPVIDDLVARGITRPAAIAVELDRLKVTTQRGGPMWHRNSVRRLLRRFGHLGPPKRPFRSLSVRDVARQLGVQEDEIYAAVRSGQLVGVRVGRKISFPTDVVERALYARSRAARVAGRS
jgi:excisionase family DNA binding protein